MIEAVITPQTADAGHSPAETKIQRAGRKRKGFLIPDLRKRDEFFEARHVDIGVVRTLEARFLTLCAELCEADLTYSRPVAEPPTTPTNLTLVFPLVVISTERLKQLKDKNKL